MHVDIFTIFPALFEDFLSWGSIRIAQEKNLLNVAVHDLRAFTEDPHRQVDDAPYGGGSGMVMKPAPFFEGVFSLMDTDDLSEIKNKTRVILFSPRGALFDQEMAVRLAAEQRMILLCGRYEGVDERVGRFLATDEVSIGDYVLAGGEQPAMVLIEAVSRLVPGVLGGELSLAEESFAHGLLEYPQYTRPASYRDMRVPEVLLSGNHQAVAEWRRREALTRTSRIRPDLLRQADLTEDDRSVLSPDETSES